MIDLCSIIAAAAQRLEQYGTPHARQKNLLADFHRVYREHPDHRDRLLTTIEASVSADDLSEKIHGGLFQSGQPKSKGWPLF